jgi:hypothetical protein
MKVIRPSPFTIAISVLTAIGLTLESAVLIKLKDIITECSLGDRLPSHYLIVLMICSHQLCFYCFGIVIILYFALSQNRTVLAIVCVGLLVLWLGIIFTCSQIFVNGVTH